MKHRAGNLTYRAALTRFGRVPQMDTLSAVRAALIEMYILKLISMLCNSDLAILLLIVCLFNINYSLKFIVFENDLFISCVRQLRFFEIQFKNQTFCGRSHLPLTLPKSPRSHLSAFV